MRRCASSASTEFDRAVVGIGTDIEASVLTVLALAELGVARHLGQGDHRQARPASWSAVGAHHVVCPEDDMGERVAHLVTGRMLDYIEFDDGFAIAKVRAPDDMVGRTLTRAGPADQARHHGRRGQARRQGGRDRALPDTVIEPGDTLIVSGPTKKVEQIGERHG